MGIFQIMKRLLQASLLMMVLFVLPAFAKPIFILTTPNQSITVSPGGTALIGYTVQNNSGINMTQMRYLAPPLTTITATTCGDTLANHASCSVTLTLHAPNTQGRMTLGSFAVCGKNGKACSQPDKFNLVHVIITPVTSTFTITPSAGANGAISPSTPQTVNAGNSLMFTAIPNTGYQVNQWLVDGVPVQSGGNTYTLTNITANHTIAVTFSIITFVITPSAGANGSISPNTPQTVDYGSDLMFTATPNTGYLVNQWLVDGTVVQTGGTTYTLTNITANHTVAVTFTIQTFTITPSAGANGSISPSTAQTVDYGNNIMFTATPNTGYNVNQWSVDGTPVQTGGTTYTLTNVTANHTVSVTFVIQTFTVTPSAGANGSISPNTPQTVDYGNSVMFTATPNATFIVNQWLVDGVVVQTGGTTYNLTNVTANHTVEVTFLQTFTVTPSAGANGSISPSTVQTVNSGGSVMFTATPNTGYNVNQWSVDGTPVQTGGTTYTLTNVTANHTVSVTFIIQTFTVTPSAGANGSISPNTPQTVDYGSNIMFTATPNTGYNVNQWSVDGTPVQTGGTTYTLTNVTANHTVSVTFVIQTFTVTPSAGANGAISPSTAQTVDYGSNIMFTATPNTGYNVNQWSVDGTPVQTGGTTYTLTNVTANHTVSVTFVIQTFTVTPSAGANGSISPSTPQTVNYNASIMFTATPNTGYNVDQWLVDGTLVQTGGTTFTLSNVTADHTVAVSFVIQTFTVTPGTSGNSGSISPNTPQTVNYGGSVMFTATPNAGALINQWLLDGSDIQDGGTSYTLSSVTADHTVTAAFVTPAYVTNHNNNTISYCDINTDGTLSNCIVFNPGASFVTSPSGAAVNATVTFAYFVGPGNNTSVGYCAIHHDGSLSSCTQTGSSFTLPFGIALGAAGTNGAGFAYITDNSNGDITVCAINGNGSFGTCTAYNDLGAPAGITVGQAGTRAANFLYVADQEDGIVFCVINSDGSVPSSTCNITGSGYSFVFAVSLGTVNGTTYLYAVTNSPSAGPYVCPINSNGSVGACINTVGGSGIGFQGIAINAAGTVAYMANGTSVYYCPIVQSGINQGTFGTCTTTGNGFTSPFGIGLSNGQ